MASFDVAGAAALVTECARRHYMVKASSFSTKAILISFADLVGPAARHWPNLDPEFGQMNLGNLPFYSIPISHY
jgi:hypothetical protein